MAFNPQRLRRIFAASAILIVLGVTGLYFYARMRVRSALKDIPQKLGIEVQQSTEGFTFSKSEGGHTLFSIKATKAVRYKQGGRATLQDVNIMVYGRKSNRFDQIHGANFEYDPASGEVAARGDVTIDLAANDGGGSRPDRSPPGASGDAIHLKTSGLVFNQKSGMAGTKEAIEFNTSQASGSAVGASYDSKTNRLSLLSKIVMHADRAASKTGSASTVTAQSAVITREPRQAVLQGVHAAGGDRVADVQSLTLDLRDDNSIHRVLARGEVRASTTGSRAMRVRSDQAEIAMAESNGTGKSRPKAAVLSGNVSLEQDGPATTRATAQRVDLAFGSAGRLSRGHASGSVRMSQGGTQATELTTDSMDFTLRDGKSLERAVTSGPGRIEIAATPSQPAKASTAAGAGSTVATAGRFEALFGAGNVVRSLHGTSGARIVSSTPGQPDRVSTSRELLVEFAPAARPSQSAAAAGSGGITAVTQEGDVRYTEGARTASAGKARYSARDEWLVLTDSPRFSEAGISATANLLRLNRQTGDAQGEGDVKTTYSDLKPQQAGALLASAEPIHVTAARMTASRSSNTARYSGGARLWQGANVIQAPTLDFDRQRRRLVATGTGAAAGQVSTVFVQTDHAGKVTPVEVTASKLTYDDEQRRARFEGGVRMRGADGEVTGDHLDVILYARGEKPPEGASQVEKVVAEGNITIQQPNRKATGERLVYTSANGEFALTGTEAKPPSIFDAEQGSVTGNSLTFFSRDDRVLVGGRDSQRTVTQTRVRAKGKE